MLDESDYATDSAYTLALPPCPRDRAATEISIRVDDGADIVLEVGAGPRASAVAYLTLDQAEDLSAALCEILRLASDRTGAIDGAAAAASAIAAPDEAAPRAR